MVPMNQENLQMTLHEMENAAHSQANLSPRGRAAVTNETVKVKAVRVARGFSIHIRLTYSINGNRTSRKAVVAFMQESGT